MRAPHLLLGVAVGLLALAGCSSDSDGDRPPSAASTVTATTVVTETTVATTAPPTPVTPDTPVTGGPASTAVDAPPVDLTQPPTTYVAARAHVLAGTDVGELTSFTTPSGNIYCAVAQTDQPVACEISEGAIEDPAVCTVPEISRFVSRVEIDGGVPSAVCATDTIRLPDPPVLAYGQTTTTRDTQCVSEKIGVTCVARNGSGGFFLARGRYALLNP